MTTARREQKTAFRNRIRADLARLSSADRKSASEQACALLKRQNLWAEAQSILFYAPLPSEVDLWPLLVEALQAGRLVALPRFSAETGRYVPCKVLDLLEDVEPGKYGIREPVTKCAIFPLNRLDLILAPGVAFDLRGGRLGRGKGYYDRLLAETRGTICGVGFDQQIVPDLPVESHDVLVNCILTPTRWIELQTARGLE
jgi:5-formyltetrahydrofolate cyclo-ligase